MSRLVLYDPWLTEMGVQGGGTAGPALLDAAPNPFTETVSISVSADTEELKLYDCLGRLIRVLHPVSGLACGTVPVNRADRFPVV